AITPACTSLQQSVRPTKAILCYCGSDTATRSEVSAASWHGCSEASRERDPGGAERGFHDCSPEPAVGTEYVLSARSKLANAGRGGIPEKSTGGKARDCDWRQEALHAKLRRVSRGRWQWKAEEARCRFAIASRTGAERWDIILENHQWESRPRYAILQPLAGNAALAVGAFLADTEIRSPGK